MPKSKPKATMMVADGRGGLMRVEDRRFEPPGDWPIRFDVPKPEAGAWLRYFHAERERRDWSSSGIGQIDASENSGSISVNGGSSEKPQFAVVWERRREGSLKVRARPEGQPPMLLAELQAFFDNVNERSRSRAIEYVYRRRTLEYNGLAWRGEFWLDERLRLGPPSMQHGDALSGPRAIVVDAQIESVGVGDSLWAFEKQLDELAAFLSVVLGTNVRVTKNGRPTWTWGRGSTTPEVRNVGYWEPENPKEMPAPGTSHPVPLRSATRPDFTHRGLDDVEFGELPLPSDTAELWSAFRALSPELRQQFLQAAAKFQEGAMLFAERDTLSAALMVVACEALKPDDPQYRDHNVYDVVTALLGESHAKAIDVGPLRAQKLRSSHLHAGVFHGSEFVEAAVHSSYEDPSFDELRRALWPVTRETIIEWLRRGGVFTMPPLKRNRKRFRRRVRENAIAMVPIAAATGVAVGWFLRSLSWA